MWTWGGVAFDRGASESSAGPADLTQRRISSLLAGQPVGRQGKATLAGRCQSRRTPDRLAGGSWQTPAVAVSVHDFVATGPGGSGLVWPPLAYRNRPAQFETDGAAAAYLGKVRGHDGKRTAGGGAGLQSGACDHVPSCAARQHRSTAVEFHLCLQYRAGWLPQSLGRSHGQTATAGTRTHYRPGRPLPTAQTCQTTIVSARGVGAWLSFSRQA